MGFSTRFARRVVVEKPGLHHEDRPEPPSDIVPVRLVVPPQRFDLARVEPPVAMIAPDSKNSPPIRAGRRATSDPAELQTPAWAAAAIREGHGDRGCLEGGACRCGPGSRHRAVISTLALSAATPPFIKSLRQRRTVFFTPAASTSPGPVQPASSAAGRGHGRPRRDRASRVITSLLEEPVADRCNWTIPRLRGEVEAQRRCTKGFRWRRPRHTLKGRQVAAEVERVGLLLQLRRTAGGSRRYRSPLRR